MKKLVSILTSLTLLTTLTGSYVGAVESDDSDLYAIARSLGADTDALKIVNYSFWDYNSDNEDEMPDKYGEYYIEFLKKNSLLEGVHDTIGEFTKLSFSGSCLGISLLEILSHNGVISPSDVRGNAKKMSDITLDDDVDKMIFGYQWLQSFTEFSMYEKYLTSSFSYEEQIDRLVEIAENCITGGKYFLITVHTKKMSHAVCGMGITDGNWEFNGVNYDKCILTLDSNCVDGNKNSTPFSNKCCIYINSETKQSYIPAYEIGNETPVAYAAIDDDSLLNFKGMINPSETVNTDVSSLTEVGGGFGKYNRNTKAFVVSETGEEYELDDSSFNIYNSLDVIDKFHSVRFEMEHEYEKHPMIRYNNLNRWIDIELMNDPVYKEYDYGDYNAVIDISDNKIKAENFSDIPLHLHYHIGMDDGSFDFAPYFMWMFTGTVDKEIVSEVKEKGMLIQPNGNIDLNVYAYYYSLDDDGNYEIDYSNLHAMPCFARTPVVPYDKKERHIKAANNVFVTVEDGDFVFLLDTNNDDVYDVPVEKGDVNFDGSTDASDASDVLRAYAALSTKQIANIDPVLADYNNDGIIDASDASGILAFYASNMTK